MRRAGSSAFRRAALGGGLAACCAAGWNEAFGQTRQLFATVSQSSEERLELSQAIARGYITQEHVLELPSKIPDGFSRHFFPHVKSILCLPNEWHVYTESTVIGKEGSIMYSLIASKEHLAKEGSYTTGIKIDHIACQPTVRALLAAALFDFHMKQLNHAVSSQVLQCDDAFIAVSPEHEMRRATWRALWPEMRSQMGVLMPPLQTRSQYVAFWSGQVVMTLNMEAPEAEWDATRTTMSQICKNSMLYNIVFSKGALHQD